MTHYMRQAITTKWLAPTDRRGSRVKAVCEAGSVTLDWDHALNVDDNHRAAASELARRLKWTGVWYGGAMRGAGYCFVLSDEAAFTVTK